MVIRILSFLEERVVSTISLNDGPIMATSNLPYLVRLGLQLALIPHMIPDVPKQ